MKHKRKYENPTFVAFLLDKNDIITTSGDEPFFGWGDKLDGEDSIKDRVETPTIPLP